MKKGAKDLTAVMPRRPRIEPGHTYLAAIGFAPATCGEGDPYIPASWTLLGERAILPYDDSTIGLGEFEGREVTPDEVQKQVPGKASLVSQVLGGSASDLAGCATDL